MPTTQTSNSAPQNATQSTTAHETKTGGSQALKDEASQNLDAVKRDVEHLVDRASEEAEKLSEAAREYGSAFANRRKVGTADTISGIAQSLRESGEKLSDRPNLHSIMENAAESLEDVAESIRTRSFSDLYSDAETFARERPLTVAAGAAVFGLLVARFLKSSGDRASSRRNWDGHDSDYPRSDRYGR